MSCFVRDNHASWNEKDDCEAVVKLHVNKGVPLSSRGRENVVWEKRREPVGVLTKLLKFKFET